MWPGDGGSPRSSVGSMGPSTMTTSSSSSDSGDELKSLSRPASDSVLLPSLIRMTPEASSASLGALGPRPRGRPAGRSRGSARGVGRLQKWVGLEWQAGREQGPGAWRTRGPGVWRSLVFPLGRPQPHFWAGRSELRHHVPILSPGWLHGRTPQVGTRLKGVRASSRDKSADLMSVL